MKDEMYLILDSAGWYEHRNINIDYELEILQREGFTIPNENITMILKEFWNLRLEFTLPDGASSDIELNIETAIANFDDDAVKIYERIVDKELIPVGVLHFQTALILVSLDLNFYLVAEEGIYRIAESFISFLDVIINRKEVHKFTFEK